MFIIIIIIIGEDEDEDENGGLTAAISIVYRKEQIDR